MWITQGENVFKTTGFQELEEIVKKNCLGPQKHKYRTAVIYNSFFINKGTPNTNSSTHCVIKTKTLALLCTEALFIHLNSKVVSILPSSSEENLSCYYCSWLLKFFTKSLVGDLTHCFSVYVSSKKISILISSLAAKNHTPSPHKPKSHPPARDWELAHLCWCPNIILSLV